MGCSKISFHRENLLSKNSWLSGAGAVAVLAFSFHVFRCPSSCPFDVNGKIDGFSGWFRLFLAVEVNHSLLHLQLSELDPLLGV